MSGTQKSNASVCAMEMTGTSVVVDRRFDGSRGTATFRVTVDKEEWDLDGCEF
jgi:hypothetical protein